MKAEARKATPEWTASKKPAAPDESAPIDGDSFAGLMQNFAPIPARLAAAVSGGPDSMALAFCLKRWMNEWGQKPFKQDRHARESGHPVWSTGSKKRDSRLRGSDDCSAYPRTPNPEPRTPVLTAFIVDHGLRAESAREAGQTCAALRHIGIEAEILRWEHEPVTARLHVRARDARYRLLAEACRERGIDTLFLGHQQEDQAETILMRLAKGSGIDGLRGMDAESRFENIRLLRPFLAVPRARLTATCRAQSLTFITDPGNEAQKFARGRLRRVMPLLSEEGLTIERLADLGARAGEAKAALDHHTSMLLRVAGKRDEAGFLRLDLEQLRAAPRAIGLRALDASLRAVHPGLAYGVERASLLPLLDRLCADGIMPPRTLHGCLIAKNAREAIVMREYAAIMEEMRIRPGESILWDGRWEVTLSSSFSLVPSPLSPSKGKGIRDKGKDSENTASFLIRPLGHPPHALLDRLAPGLRHKIPQGRARAPLPALYRAGDDVPVLIPDLAAMAADGAAQSMAHAKFLLLWPPDAR